VNSGCARKPGAISEADGSNAVDASDAKTLANEDKPVGSTTASDAASSLIALSQEENSKVGGSQEDVEDASEAKKLVNEDTAEGSNTARDASPDSIAPNEEENSKVGGVHKYALVVNEDNTANEKPRHIPGIFDVTSICRRICRQYVTISPIFIGLPYFTD